MVLLDPSISVYNSIKVLFAYLYNIFGHMFIMEKILEGKFILIILGMV
jgi:hypothetical protein